MSKDAKTLPPPPEGDVSLKTLRSIISEYRREASRSLARMNDLERLANKLEGLEP